MCLKCHSFRILVMLFSAIDWLIDWLVGWLIINWLLVTDWILHALLFLKSTEILPIVIQYVLVHVKHWLVQSSLYLVCLSSLYCSISHFSYVFFFVVFFLFCFFFALFTSKSYGLIIVKNSHPVYLIKLPVILLMKDDSQRASHSISVLKHILSKKNAVYSIGAYPWLICSCGVFFFVFFPRSLIGYY